MGVYTKVSGKMTLVRDLGVKYINMGNTTLENGAKVSETVKESIIARTFLDIREAGLKTRKMAKDSRFGLIMLNMRANIRMGKNMGSGSLHGTTGRHTKETLTKTALKV